ncbi:unnamed protein product [Urochloa decumbens]|uniref:Late embryogenesis abundant protein LEA-2 subgroup domain-containing protein n=1 Tax=Urochloa decumbens TaxID=240449 RepID=A0ABC9DLF4_9POAL
MPAESEYSCCALCGTCVLQSLLVVMASLLLAYAMLDPVRVTVRDASLARLAPLNNGTAAAPLAYDLSLAVAVLNPNWAMRAVHAAPLDAELLFAGRQFCGTRLVAAAGAGRSIGQEKSDEIRMTAAGETSGSAAEVLGSDGVAELVKETVAGHLESLELKLSGEVRYRPVHVGRYRLDVTCPLRLPAPGTNSGDVVVLDRVIKCHKN